MPDEINDQGDELNNDDDLNPGDEEPQGDELGDGDDEPQEGEEELGDKGKRALDRMKKDLREQRKAAREARRELEELKRQQENAGKSDDEKAIEEARQEARNEALQAANQRIIRSEVKAAAAGKLADASLATKLIDLDDIEVDDDGNVNEEDIATAIDDLLDKHPFLAAQGSTGKFDSARGKKRKSKKYTPDDLKGLSTKEINEAYAKGLIDLD